MNLSELIARLAVLPSSLRIVFLHQPHSYRGYYERLAFEIDESRQMAVSEALDLCRALVGTEMSGYKGGTYRIGDKTLIHLAHYGETGVQLVGVEDDGRFKVYDSELQDGDGYRYI
jgi:hypothetical protein